MNRTAIIVGGGRVGRHTAEHLLEQGFTITVVEHDPDKCAQLDNHLAGRIVQGDGSDEAVLDELDIEGAGVVAALTNDTRANVIVCGLVRESNPEVRTLARIARDGEQDYQHLKDIDEIVYPAAAGAAIAADRILQG